MTKLSGPMLAPQNGAAPRRLVVLLHGYGADGSDLIDLGRHWGQLLPDALFLAPNAPEPCAGSPFGFQWFALDVERATARLEGSRAASVVLHGFLADLWAQTGLGPEDTILVGFSQGAMMALTVGTALSEPLAGIVAFSGAFIAPEGFEAGRFARPPVALIHGDLDQVVPVTMTQQAAEALSAAGFAVQVHVSAGTAHGIAPDGLDFATRFIASRSGGGATQ